MNEKLQYATMLEIPVNTCNITYKPAKKRRGARRRSNNPEAVKEELLTKVNAASAQGSDADAIFKDNTEAVADSAEPTAIDENTEEAAQSATVRKGKRKPIFRFSVITAEAVAIFALIATIFLTNAFYADSAINVFMKRVFSPDRAATVQEKTYADFAPVVRFDGEMTLNNGVMTYSGSGAVYAPCDGVVSSVVREEDGSYTMTVAHSGVFSSTVSGLLYAYLGAGDSVYGNIPVGYVKDGGFSLCFNAGDAVITDYTVEDNAVLWAV